MTKGDFFCNFWFSVQQDFYVYPMPFCLSIIWIYIDSLLALPVLSAAWGQVNHHPPVTENIVQYVRTDNRKQTIPYKQLSSIFLHRPAPPLVFLPSFQDHKPSFHYILYKKTVLPLIWCYLYSIMKIEECSIKAFSNCKIYLTILGWNEIDHISPHQNWQEIGWGVCFS